MPSWFKRSTPPRASAHHTLLILAATALVCWATYKLPSPVVLGALALLPLAALVTLRAPFVICLSFISLSLFRLHEAFTILQPFKLPMLLALGSLASLGTLLFFRRLKLAWEPEIKVFLALFALMTLGVVFAENREVSMAYWKDSFAKIALMTLAISSLAQRTTDFAQASRVFAACGAAISAVAIDNWLNGVGLVEGSRVTIGREFRSLLGDPNDLALVLLFPLSFAASLAMTKGTGRWSRLLGAAGAVLCCCAILATGSRGGLLGTMAVAAVFLAEKLRSKFLMAALAVPPVLVLLALAAMRGGGEGRMDESAFGRVTAWKAAFRMAFEHPVMGVGINGYRQNYFFYTDHWEGLAKAVHSTWLAALSEGGWLALGLFIALFAITVRSALASRQALSPEVAGTAYNPETYAMARALCSGLAGFAVAGTFLTQAFTWNFYILVALVVALRRFSGETRDLSRTGRFRHAILKPS